MHTLKIRVPDRRSAVACETATREIEVHYNSDWSGDVKLFWKDDSGLLRGEELPGWIFLAVSQTGSKEKIKGDLISYLEQYETGVVED